MYVNELYLLTNHPVFIGLKQQLPICSLLASWAELSGNGSPSQGVSWVPAHVCIQLTVHSLIHLCSSWLEAWRLLGYESLTTQQAVWAHSHGGSFRVPKSCKKKASSNAQVIFKTLESQASHFLVSLAKASHISKPRANLMGTTLGVDSGWEIIVIFIICFNRRTGM